jgi:antirestriction protein ArdC
MSHISGKRDIARHVTDTILATLKEGVLPWRKPWASGCGSVDLPLRANSAPYRGANVIMLWSAAITRGFSSPYWLTLKQANAAGARVRRGEHGEIVIYYGKIVRTAQVESGEEREQSFGFLKSYTVFNADQIDGLDRVYYPGPRDEKIMTLGAHEIWFAKLGIDRILTRDTACYMPARDCIGMPPACAFNSAADYAATLDHEAVHATMADHRVGRDLQPRYGAHARAVEELVAEIGAAILGAHLGLPPHHIEDHSAYIGHWMDVLANDKRAFFKAAAHAQRAVDWVLEKSPAPDAEFAS